jgi:3-oxoacyl-[acyl-carrier-protein] synthase-3
VRPQHLYLAGMGMFLPERFVTAAKAIEQGRYTPEEHELGGWESAAVAGDIPAPEMAVRAANEALATAKVRPEDICLLIHACTYHQGPDGWSPQHYVQRHTIGGDAPAIEIRQGCNGVVGAIELAACYLQADSDRTEVLITTADNFGTPLMDRWRSINNVVLGDAALGIVVSNRGGFARVLSLSAGSAPALESLHRGDEPMFPPGATVNRVVDFHARAMQFGESRASVSIPDAGLIGNATATVVKRSLAEADVDVSRIKRVTHVHWGHERYLRRTLEPLGLDVAQGMLEFGRRVGHLGASDQFAGLHHLLSTGQLEPGDLVLTIGIGAGISLACAVVEILDVP